MGDSAEWAVLDDWVRCRFAGPGVSSLADEARFFGESELMLTVTGGLPLASRARLVLAGLRSAPDEGTLSSI